MPVYINTRMAVCERAIDGLKPFKKNLVMIRNGICERYNNQVLSPLKILIFTPESHTEVAESVDA